MKKSSSYLFFPILAGLIFFAFNSWYSYSFYHVNSFKMLYMGSLMIMLFIIYDVVFLGYKKIAGEKISTEFDFPWKEALLFLLPVFATYPGYFLNFNEPLHYNHDYELVIRLIILLWIVYLIRFFRTDRGILAFLIIAGISMLYVWFFGVLETFNNSPFLQGNESYTGRIKVTYGNINYLAGAMVPIIPIFLTLALPKITRNSFRFQFQSFLSIPLHLLFLTFFLATLYTLFQTVTRAAIAASMLVCILTLFLLFIQTFERKKIARYFLLYGSIVAGLLLTIIVLIFLFRDELSPYSRFVGVFYLSTWYGRFIAWEPSIEGFFLSPLFGYGLGVSYALFFRHINPDSRIFWGQRSYNHAHSEWIEYLAEGGIFGYACFFILWGYVFYHLIKFFFSSNASILHQRIMLGCATGMLGFYVHGVFSVSQRMIVTNVPQFALLAIAFVLIAYHQNLEKKLKKETKENRSPKILSSILRLYRSWLEKWKKLPSLVRHQLPCLLIILLGIFLYYPWAKTQYEFVKISKAGKSIFQTNKMEKLKEKREDIYMMDSLTRWLISYKNYDGALQNVNEMEKVLPNYRINGYFLGLIHFYKGDVQKAHEEVKKYIKSDNYYEPANNLYHRLTTFVGDQEGNLENIKYIFRRSVNREDFPYFDFTLAQEQKENILFKETIEPVGVEVSFSKNFLEQVFNLTREHYRLKMARRRTNGARDISNLVYSEILSAAIRDKYIEFIPKTENADDQHQAKLLEIKALSIKDAEVQAQDKSWDAKSLAEIIQNAGEVERKLKQLWRAIENYRNVLNS